MRSKRPQSVNVHAAKTHFSKLLAKVANGEEVVIANAGKPVAKLVPYETEHQNKRPLGLYRGQIRIAADFDAPDPEIEKLFYGDQE